MSRRLAALAAFGLLAGCASAPSEPDTDQAARMFDETLSLAPIAESVMRNGDTLSFMVLQPRSDASPISFLAQLEGACSQPQARLMYLDGAQRTYFGNPPNAYAPGRQLPATQAQKLHGNPSFRQACAATAAPDWRVIKGSGEQQWVLIDRSSLRKVGEAMQFWGAYDSPVIGHDLPFNAPYAQKREHYAVDCARQTFQLLAGYNVDERNTVTDGGVFFQPKDYSVSGSDADYQLLFKTVCESPDALAKLSAFAPRQRAPVAGTAAPAVQAAVLSAVKQLNLPPPRKPLKHLVETGQATLEGNTAAFREELFITPDKVTGQLSVRTQAQGFQGQAISFRGLLALAHRTVFTGNDAMIDSASLRGLSFTGDWQQMPVGAQLGYTREGRMSNSLVGEYGKERQSFVCTVSRQVAATQVNATLSGQAKELRCQHQEDRLARVDTLYYLEDYGYFFHAGTDKNDFFYETRTLQSAE